MRCEKREQKYLTVFQRVFWTTWSRQRQLLMRHLLFDWFLWQSTQCFVVYVHLCFTFSCRRLSYIKTSNVCYSLYSLKKKNRWHFSILQQSFCALPYMSLWAVAVRLGCKRRVSVSNVQLPNLRICQNAEAVIVCTGFPVRVPVKCQMALYIDLVCVWNLLVRFHMA